VPSGRHARDLGALAEHEAASPQRECEDLLAAPPKLLPTVGRLTHDTPVATPIQVITATGRRARPAAPAPAPVPRAAPLPQPALVLTPTAAPEPIRAGGTGRRRKPVESIPEIHSAAPSGDHLPSGTGRRRRSISETEDRLVCEALIQPGTPVPAVGTGRRRRPAEVTEPAPAVPVIEASAVLDPVVPARPEPEAVLAEVIPLRSGHRGRAHSGARRKPRSTVGPGAPALVAGAAAVAVAAVGALNATGSGLQLGAGSADLARASTLGLKDNSVLLDGGQARASRDRARKALAAREKAAAAAQKKHDVLLEALQAAKQRAARLAALAHLYRLPVSGYHLTAGFGEGGGLWSHGHTGQDFACPTGTPIHAVASGTIISAGWDGAYGWKTVERLADGTEIWYAHQSAMLVRSGPVYAGEVIGRVGSTGNTTGPHLHLEVRPHGGAPINPMPWLRAHGMRP
jgi:murein DD-endopeptidase MepM/ murein hydrolase activator NlpD